MIFTDLLFI